MKAFRRSFGCIVTLFLGISQAQQMVPGPWVGSTTQGEEVSFVVAEDGESISNFELTALTHFDFTNTVNGNTRSYDWYGSYHGSIDRMSVTDGIFSGSVTVSGTGRLQITGAAVSAETVEGTFSGLTFDRDSNYPYGTIFLEGNGTWTASPVSPGSNVSAVRPQSWGRMKMRKTSIARML